MQGEQENNTVTTLLQRFVSEAGVGMRVNGTYDEPWFCVKDVCDALGIANHRNKTRILREDQKRACKTWTPSGRQTMVFVSESGIYRIMFSCQEANIPGTPCYSFTCWVTEQVLPSIRRNGRYELEEEIRELKSERGRRLWILLKKMDRWTFNARRKFFGSVCNACTKGGFVYLDSYGAPHVTADNIQQAERVMAATMSAKILSAVPANQRLITAWLR